MKKTNASKHFELGSHLKNVCEGKTHHGKYVVGLKPGLPLHLEKVQYLGGCFQECLALLSSAKLSFPLRKFKKTIPNQKPKAFT